MTDEAPPTEAPLAETPNDAPPRRRAGRAAPIASGAVVLAILLAGGLLRWRAGSTTDAVALAPAPKSVTLVAARAARYQPSRSYVGTMDPWLAANIGPQLVSGYVTAVLVRPGAVVKRGQVLATLDCRDASASSQAVAGEARAIDARQKASASEAARLDTLLAKQLVSPDEAEQKSAQSLSEEAELQAMRATLAQKGLEVSDCVLRAPFDGEVATRSVDPGAFVRPGTTIVSIVDRSTLRLTADAPETDFGLVAPGRRAAIDVAATGAHLAGTIARRAPAADPSTRTVHFEIDLADPERNVPVGTTGEARLDVGDPVPATAIPLSSAAVRGKKATIFVVEGGVAHARTVEVKGEAGGELLVDTALAPGALVVTEGRALLRDGDRVAAVTGSGHGR